MEGIRIVRTKTQNSPPIERGWGFVWGCKFSVNALTGADVVVEM